MAIQTEPTRIQIPFADSGTKNVIPDTNSTPSASQAASWTDGFPAQCSLPLSAGGIPPARADFNGILNAMTQSERFTQEGGVWEWGATVDYAVNRVVLGSDGLLYWSVAQSGPNVGGAQDPTTDNGTYWQAMPMNDADVVHITGTETITGSKTFTEDVVILKNYGHLYLKNTTAEKAVSSGSPEYYGAISTLDKAGLRLAAFRSGRTAAGDLYGEIAAYDPSDPTPGAGAANGYIAVFTPSGGSSYATAPSTQTGRTGGTDIVTRDWIPKDTRILLASGANPCTAPDALSRDRDDSIIYLYGGTTANNGAYLAMTGPANSTSGIFALHASNTGNDKSLRGTPSGTLTWNGQPVQTSSDERIKTPLSIVPEDVLDAWEAVGWGQFRYLEAVAEKGESARLHLGLIAQRVKAVFEERGLDACQYGILCHEEREATEDEPAVDLWMVRYTEALAMEACCQRRRADRAEARLVALEERLTAIEAKLLNS